MSLGDFLRDRFGGPAALFAGWLATVPAASESLAEAQARGPVVPSVSPRSGPLYPVKQYAAPQYYQSAEPQSGGARYLGGRYYSNQNFTHSHSSLYEQHKFHGATFSARH